MIDQRLVGAIIRRDLSDYAFTADDARLIVRQRTATPVASLLPKFPESASPEATDILLTASYKAKLQSLLLARTANDVSRILDAAGIPALVYKGVAVASANQGTWHGRESIDVDVLVPTEAVGAAHRAFMSAGLVRVNGRTDPPGRLFTFHSIETAYVGLPRTVDLHWHLASQRQLNIPFDTLWATRRRLVDNGVEVWTPAAAVSTVLSAVHGTKENWHTLRHMLDFASAVSRLPSQSWNEVEEISRFGSAKPLAVALGIAELCNTPGMPAAAGTWGRQMSRDYIDSWASDIDGAQTQPRSPLNSIKGHARRARMAPNLMATVDGWLRFSLMVTNYKTRILLGRETPPQAEK